MASDRQSGWVYRRLTSVPKFEPARSGNCTRFFEEWNGTCPLEMCVCMCVCAEGDLRRSEQEAGSNSVAVATSADLVQIQHNKVGQPPSRSRSVGSVTAAARMIQEQGVQSEVQMETEAARERGCEVDADDAG